MKILLKIALMLVFGDCLEIKDSSLARLCDTYWCNFVREHGIGFALRLDGRFA